MWSSWSGRHNWKDGINNEERFMKIWIIDGVYKWLGHTTTVVGHEILIQQASLASFSPYILFFGHEPQLLTSIHKDVVHVVNLDDFNVWVEACEQCATLFKRIMAYVNGKLGHFTTSIYIMICHHLYGGGYWPKVQKFEHGDYVYLQ